MRKTATVTIPLRVVERVFGLTTDTACERYAQLTPRERQVADLMATGKPNREIAAELAISIKTLDIHRTNAKNKLQTATSAAVANLVHLMQLAEHVDSPAR